MTSSEQSPPRVQEVENYERPTKPSARCLWWLGRIENGWRPSKRVKSMGYSTRADYMGVTYWEYLHVLAPAEWGNGKCSACAYDAQPGFKPGECDGLAWAKTFVKETP